VNLLYSPVQRMGKIDYEERLIHHLLTGADRSRSPGVN
jgi:hypothetical protein